MADTFAEGSELAMDLQYKKRAEDPKTVERNRQTVMAGIDKVSKDELTNVGLASLVSALTLTSADGATARALVAELERAAIARLDTELKLSRAAVAAGGPSATEEDILKTWTDDDVASLRTMSDIEVGGSSQQTFAAIEAAANRVKQAGEQRVQSLPR